MLLQLLLLLVELLLVVLHHLVVHLLHLLLREGGGRRRRGRGEEVAHRVLLRLRTQGRDAIAPESEYDAHLIFLYRVTLAVVRLGWVDSNLGSFLARCDAIAVTYCPRPVDHAKYKSTQHRPTTTLVTLQAYSYVCDMLQLPFRTLPALSF